MENFIIKYINMKYMWSKNRIAKYLLPIILKDRKEWQWYVEPFVWGANMIDKVDGNRKGCDINEYLIEFLRELSDGVFKYNKFYYYSYKNIIKVWKRKSVICFQPIIWLTRQCMCLTVRFISIPATTGKHPMSRTTMVTSI